MSGDIIGLAADLRFSPTITTIGRIMPTARIRFATACCGCPPPC